MTNEDLKVAERLRLIVTSTDYYDRAILESKSKVAAYKRKCVMFKCRKWEA
jgi:hypothetical protein